MGTKYSSNSASGYNSTPPADDGTVSEANKVKYSTIKTKLADPSKDLADTINTDLVTHFDNGPNAYTTNQTLGATHYNQVNQVSGSGVTLTLSDASALTAGWYTEIISTDTTNNVTLARATASNTINETSADVTILPLQHLRVIVNSAATGFLVSTQGRHTKEYKSAENRTISGTVTMSGKSLWMAEGAAVASAADCNIWTTDGNTVHVTGTTTISDWGTAPQAGAWKRIIFDGALTLTYNATTNDIEGGVDVTVAAGDSVEVYAVSTSAYQVRNISRNSVDEVSVASAATTNIGATASENVNITGTTTITGLGTIGAGVVKNVRFAGALTLTHNATSLILPGSANITTAANDTAIFQSLGSGNWICTNYKKASGAPITVTESSLGAASVSQTKLKTTTGEVSVAAASQNLTLPGGEYGFYPQIKIDTGSMTATTGSSATNTSYVTNIHLNATNNGYAQHRYIQASPPYDLGDGEIQLFVFALLDSSGNIVATYVAPEAPWHNNGPTDIRADYHTSDGRGYRKIKRFFAEHGSVRQAIASGLNKEQVAVLIRDSELVNVEITQQIKNADMGLIPHPFNTIPPGHSVVLLDPVCNLMERLYYLHESGESICSMLHDRDLIVTNTEVNRNRPNGVLTTTCRLR